MAIQFTKMHGLGNDYVYVNGFSQQVADPSALAVRVSDRHFGIGGDGMILILPSATADVRMQMFNADGSEGKMCGNGIRCVAKFAYDHGLSKANPMRVESAAGIKTINLTLGADGKVSGATVDMGEPILAPHDIPVEIPGQQNLKQLVNYPLDKCIGLAGAPGWVDACGMEMAMTCVSMGNPHVMIYCRNVAAVPLETVGPVIETHSIFPHRINVHFVQVHSQGEVTMRTWERGSGITRACGTGASAVCVAGVLTGKTGRKLLAHLPGGDLQLEWRESNNRVYMTGPATEVFSGTWPE